MQGTGIRTLGFTAHPGGPLSPHDLWTAWTIELWVTIPLVLSILIYVWGTYNVWKRAGVGHGITSRQWVARPRAVATLPASPLSSRDQTGERGTHFSWGESTATAEAAVRSATLRREPVS